MSADQDDNQASKNYNKRVRQEYAELDSKRAHYQAVLDRWWSNRFGADTPAAISDYSPIARYDREADDKEDDAGRRYHRGW
jgi:hypothetical protein